MNADLHELHNCATGGHISKDKIKDVPKDTGKPSNWNLWCVHNQLLMHLVFDCTDQLGET